MIESVEVVEMKTNRGGGDKRKKVPSVPLERWRTAEVLGFGDGWERLKRENFSLSSLYVSALFHRSPFLFHFNHHAEEPSHVFLRMAGRDNSP